MEFLNDIKLCTGCGACANICPHDAVIMQEDEKGFLKPFVDTTRCTECGLCKKVCPLLNFQSDNFESPQAFAFINQNNEVRMRSSSGGVFPAFAKYIIEKGGAVFGAVYDSSLKVCHDAAYDLKDIEKMQGSKYVQSDTKYTFRAVKNVLTTGKPVLYTGSPCQIAGLKSYLGKEWENLLTIDLICHGVSSRRVFEMYKKEILKKIKDNGRLTGLNMRDKNFGWGYGFFVTITTTNASYHLHKTEDDFQQLYLHNLSINDSCLQCKFNKIPRTADITMGDFWGVEDYDSSLNDKKGISAVLLNSAKGQKYFKELISTDQIYLEEVPAEVIIRNNINIISSSIPHPRREEFFKDVVASKKRLSQLCEKYLKLRPNILKRIFRKLPPKLQRIIKRVLLK